MAAQDTRPLYPPKDFVPTSLVFGIWMGGVLAGVNYFRMGCPEKGRKVIVLSSALQICLWGVLVALVHMLSRPYEYALVGGISFFIYAPLGYYLCRTQSAPYDEWMEAHPEMASGRAYLSWWVAASAVIAAFGLASAMVFWFSK